MVDDVRRLVALVSVMLVACTSFAGEATPPDAGVEAAPDATGAGDRDAAADALGCDPSFADGFDRPDPLDWGPAGWTEETAYGDASLIDFIPAGAPSNRTLRLRVNAPASEARGRTFGKLLASRPGCANELSFDLEVAATPKGASNGVIIAALISGEREAGGKVYNLALAPDSNIELAEQTSDLNDYTPLGRSPLYAAARLRLRVPTPETVEVYVGSQRIVTQASRFSHPPPYRLLFGVTYAHPNTSAELVVDRVEFR